ncbi:MULTISPECIES: 50S ribosomal protein L21 [Jonquetella]|uniref:Large ribosomal subunit protein bL21 n=1 Tax=Jonquetella anthropi DSM 22815 TaxID=885272 RepID=H0UK95_9BACT|nr:MULTISPECIES: 50S ribosomal protein L21 [Jonquetella]EEX48485.1 ribosomal protein L21 [Jonquetella anthropi E3_33 E1]EHM13104.1 ribosomal protein L21 [Jonquetella anthropi DSM 22815]ERL23857.1 ribosomal protein L21 [Jonquetella sp. BV3C21]
MYAIIETGGKQYKVCPGDQVKVEKLGADDGASVVFDRVLMVGDGETTRLGSPLVEGACVKATVLTTDKAKKVIVFKYKNKTNYRRFRGHRQPYTLVSIDSIEG